MGQRSPLAPSFQEIIEKLPLHEEAPSYFGFAILSPEKQIHLIACVSYEASTRNPESPRGRDVPKIPQSLCGHDPKDLAWPLHPESDNAPDYPEVQGHESLYCWDTGMEDPQNNVWDARGDQHQEGNG